MNSTTAPQRSATDWLRQALLYGAVESAQVKALAEQAGIGTKALRNAREKLGVVATRRGNGSLMRSMWSLPNPDQAALENLNNWRAEEYGAGIGAPSFSAVGMPRIVKVGGTQMSTWLPTPLQPEVPRNEQQFSTIHLPTTAVELTLNEQHHVERLSSEFVTRGMNELAGHQLAVRLVTERDRRGEKSGSCIECQCLNRGSCAPGAQGHTPGPRDPHEIWMCWCSRRI